jgi:hypothetical protein
MGASLLAAIQEHFLTITQRDIQKYSDGIAFALNLISLNQKVLGILDFPVTWCQNSVLQTIKFAFGTEDELVREPDGKLIKIDYLQLPVAVFPSTVHGRMRAQKACFTLHGADRRDLREIFREKGRAAAEMLREYRISRDTRERRGD